MTAGHSFADGRCEGLFCLCDGQLELGIFGRPGLCVTRGAAFALFRGGFLLGVLAHSTSVLSRVSRHPGGVLCVAT